MTSNQPGRESEAWNPEVDAGQDDDLRLASDPDPDPEADTTPDRAPGLGEPSKHPDPDPGQ